MQVMHDDDNNITICTALYQSSGFFIIMSPAEGLHFSALVVKFTIYTVYVLVNVQCRGVYDSKPPDYEGVSPRGRCGLLS